MSKILILVLWTAAISSYGYSTNRLYAYSTSDVLFYNNTGGGQIAVSDYIIGLYYQNVSKVIYYVKDEFLAGNFSSQETKE